MSETYALFTAIGDYRSQNLAVLPMYQMDLSLMKKALVKGLRVKEENIRICGSGGNVQASEFAMSVKNFHTLLSMEDTFIFYFSGHGRKDEIVFSDMSLKLHSVLSFIEKLVCKNKIVILDCCYSGGFAIRGPKQMKFEDTIKAFVGSGIAILASSASDQESRLDSEKKHSLFSGIVGTAMMSKRNVRKGLLSFEDICHEVFELMEVWNKAYPNKMQNPIFRSNMGGTIYFKVSDERPYVSKPVYSENDFYIIYSVKSLHTANIKRLCAFVLLKPAADISDLPQITKKIVRAIKNKNIYASKTWKRRFFKRSAQVVWCYFGRDESDMMRGCYFAHTVWAKDPELKRLYYRFDCKEIDGIGIFENTSYELIKKMQTPVITKEEFIRQNKELLSVIVSMAEHFIYDLREVDNKTVKIAKIQEQYQQWIQEVRRKFLKLTDIDAAPDDLYKWSEEIRNLAGYILDLSLLLEKEIGALEMWLIRKAIRDYYQSLEKLKQLEEKKE